MSGAEKPEPAIFQAALSALQAAPETTVMVGDSLRRDYEGARRSGHRLHLDRARRTSRPPNAMALTIGPFSALLASLPDLLDILT